MDLTILKLAREGFEAACFSQEAMPLRQALPDSILYAQVVFHENMQRILAWIVLKQRPMLHC
jgi:hypothetical protein